MIEALKEGTKVQKDEEYKKKRLKRKILLNEENVHCGFAQPRM